MSELGYLYRYEAEWYSTIDEWENVHTHGPNLKLKEYPIVANTPRGCWICFQKFQLLTGALKPPDALLRDRWVSDHTRKRFAHRTKEEALAAYRRRKGSYVQHCKQRLWKAERELALVEKKSDKSIDIGTLLK